MKEPNATQATFKNKFRGINKLPKLFKLIWQTSKLLTGGIVVARSVRAAIPFFILYVGKSIIDLIPLLSSNPNGGHFGLWQLVAIEFGLVILMDSLNRALLLMEGWLGTLFSNQTSVNIIAHAATLDLEYFEDSFFYDKLALTMQQTESRNRLLRDVLTQFQDLVTIGFLATSVMIFNPLIIILFILTTVPAFLGENYFKNKFYNLTKAQVPKRRELEYLSYLGTSNETAKEIKIFSLSGFVIDQFLALSNKFYSDFKEIGMKQYVWTMFFAFIGGAGYYIAYVFILAKAIKGSISVGEVIYFAGAVKQIKASVENILIRFTAISQGAIFLDDFFEFFDIKSQIEVFADKRKFPNPIMMGFTFENVGFKYKNSNHWANRNLNFTLHPGETLALVGENGSGKTTLVKLLSRLYDPTEGRILLDGIDLKEYDLADLRSHIGVIFQDYIRYQMTLADNIGAGDIKEKENRSRIARAAKESGGEYLADKLPNGYDQLLGKRFHGGVELSGGEWQKVALARSYMRNAQVLILDEPTSALDAKSESEIFDRFTGLTKDKSSILISHRFSTVRKADRILVLEKGELIEIGTHRELLDRGGRYAELFNLQASGYH